MTNNTKEGAICELEDLMARIDGFAVDGLSTPGFLQWKEQTEAIIRRLFGEKSREAANFTQVRYTPLTHAACLSDGDKALAFQRGLAHARFALQTMIRRLGQD